MLVSLWVPLLVTSLLAHDPRTRAEPEAEPTATIMAVGDVTLGGHFEPWVDTLFARANAGKEPQSAAVYGGVPGGMTAEAEGFFKTVMAQILDAQQDVPAPA